jgi:hypothetical protein
MLDLCAMIFRLTHKLAKKIRIAPLQNLPPDRNPFIDWTAHLFTAERVQYLIVTNTTSLYSLAFTTSTDMSREFLGVV